jgi:hypothetical protein
MFDPRGFMHTPKVTATTVRFFIVAITQSPSLLGA